ncbi:MAG: class I SAM-dependent methyltransferase [Candidatus Paceibacterota bacterium]|jgi:SAM-dependent methyltransferase
MKAIWEQFFDEKITKIFNEKKVVIDIGGGLRIIKEKNNRYDPSRAWIEPLLKNVEYKILDPVPDYNPDIVGDIHALPFMDNSTDAIICIAVLEHVENPLLAAQEMLRVLKPGGYLFVYVPFLYYYHAEIGYYKDFWRFTHDSVQYLFKDFSTVEVAPVRGAIETLIRLTPLGRSNFFLRSAGFFDRILGYAKTKQVSGYNIFVVK